MAKSIFEKRYITAAQAEAAVVKANLVSVQVVKDGKQFIVTPIQHIENQTEAAIAALQEFIKNIKTEAHVTEAYDRLNGISGLTELVQTALDESIAIEAQRIEGERQMTQAQVTSRNQATKADWVHASTIIRPTKQVWAIADRMYQEAENLANDSGQPVVYPTRAQVQAECVAQGIASGTARTQFQHWFKQRADSAKEQRASFDETGKLRGITNGGKIIKVS